MRTEAFYDQEANAAVKAVLDIIITDLQERIKVRRAELLERASRPYFSLGGKARGVGLVLRLEVEIDTLELLVNDYSKVGK